MSNIRKKEIIKIIDILNPVLRAATFDGAGFGENSDLIKERTRLYRQSWIIRPLETAIEALKSEINRNSAKKEEQ